MKQDQKENAGGGEEPAGGDHDQNQGPAAKGTIRGENDA